MLVVLIVMGIFLLWLGFALYRIHRGYSLVSLGFSLLVLILIIAAFYGLV